MLVLVLKKHFLSLTCFEKTFFLKKNEFSKTSIASQKSKQATSNKKGLC
jgi:hypothetical protein